MLQPELLGIRHTMYDRDFEDEFEDEQLDDDDLDSCPNCGVEIYAEAPRCPECGHWILDDDRPERPWQMPATRSAMAVVLWLTGGVVALGVIAALLLAAVN